MSSCFLQMALLVRTIDPCFMEYVFDHQCVRAKAVHVWFSTRMLTEKPHLAGTKENNDLAFKLKEFWEEAGLDHVTLAPYNVMLSYPNMSNLNYVELLDGNNATVYKSNLTEPILTPEENKTNVVPPFNAYSPPGDVQVNQ